MDFIYNHGISTSADVYAIEFQNRGHMHFHPFLNEPHNLNTTNTMQDPQSASLIRNNGLS